ncbi:MAG: HDOD domain-containing protein [Gammaproteobacteria bacterium]
MPEEPETDSETVSSDEPHDVDGWGRRLAEQGLPAFAHTAHQISGVVADRDSSAAELARVVLQDTAMTAKLLRIANSPLYAQTGRGVSTVSRAVIMLGFEAVRGICLSIAVVESLVAGKRKEQLAREMALAFHAAVQARTFAVLRKDHAPEEVYIATLLYNLGEMAFWTHAEGQGDELQAVLYSLHGGARAEAEQQVLGFKLRELTAGLGREWKLGSLLIHALEDRKDADPRVSNVVLGQEVAQVAMQGWKSAEMKRLLGRVAETLYLPLDKVTNLVESNAAEAAKTASFYGAGEAGRLIPLPARYNATAVDKAEPPAADPIPAFPEADPMLQLRILRELSSLIDERPDLNLLLEMVLEGIHRGVGMDRTLFALRTPNRKYLKARYALGWQKDRLQQRFVFELDPLKANVFSHMVEVSGALWVPPEPDRNIKGLLTPEVVELTAGAPFFVMSIDVGGQPIGLFYADRQPSARPLDDDSYTSFKHFCQQANLALSQTTRQSPPRKP